LSLGHGNELVQPGEGEQPGTESIEQSSNVYLRPVTGLIPGGSQKIRKKVGFCMTGASPEIASSPHVSTTVGGWSVAHVPVDIRGSELDPVGADSEGFSEMLPDLRPPLPEEEFAENLAVVWRGELEV